MAKPNAPCQALVTRLPYASQFRVKPILEMAKLVDSRGLVCVSMPINVETPSNGSRLVADLEDAGLSIVALCAWFRDRHIVTSRSKRLTNAWEPVAIFSRRKDYHFNRDSATKIKKGFEGRDVFAEDEYISCIGDHWPVRNDRRDRRFLPSVVVLNCGQLADLQQGDRILDPYGNPGVKDTCSLMGWEYVDGGLPNSARKSERKRWTQYEGKEEGEES